MSGGGKMVRVGDTDLHFSDIAALEACIVEEQRALIAIEEGPLNRDPRDLNAWRDVEVHAAWLLDLLGALDAWIANDDAKLDREIEAARQSIRALGSTSL